MIEISRIPTSSPFLLTSEIILSKTMPPTTTTMHPTQHLLSPLVQRPPRRNHHLHPPTTTTIGSTNQTTTSTKKKKKKVTFAVHNEPANVSPSTESPLYRLDHVDQWASLWYSYDELSVIKNEVYQTSHCLKRYIIMSSSMTGPSHLPHHQHQQQPPPSTRTTVIHTPSLSISDETRGLESRSCPERQRRKYLTLRYVLNVAASMSSHHPSSHHHPDTAAVVAAETVASRARLCSQWATQLAHAEAQRDYVRAYGNDGIDDDTHDDDSCDNNNNDNQHMNNSSSTTTTTKRLRNNNSNNDSDDDDSYNHSRKRMRS